MSLHIGSIAPDFEQDSSLGKVRFHEWLGSSWGILFSHPKDFTPVCTTELGRAANLRAEFEKRGVKMLAVSVDDVDSHKRWLSDIEDTQSCKLEYPILADSDRKIAKLYDMIHPEANDTLTVRSVFFIDPNKKIRAIITYPASTGRNFQEILRVIESWEAKGPTNGGAGLELAFELAKDHGVPGGKNAVILCTDGDFNSGPTREEELGRIIDQHKEGATLSIYGFGRGRQIDVRLEKLALRGGGSSGYVNTRREAEQVLAGAARATYELDPTTEITTRVAFDDAPFGVGYFVVSWEIGSS